MCAVVCRHVYQLVWLCCDTHYTNYSHIQHTPHTRLHPIPQTTQTIDMSLSPNAPPRDPLPELFPPIHQISNLLPPPSAFLPLPTLEVLVKDEESHIEKER